MNEAKIINDSYNLVKWLLPIVARYPRSYRYSLGLRIENCMYDLIEGLQTAYHLTDKSTPLKLVSVKLEHLRILVRLSKDLHLFDNAIHHAFIEQIDTVGKQLGGWIKAMGAK